MFFDPKTKPDNKWEEYATWDAHAIRQCDICFAYMGKDNPSGYGMAAEIGYAKALNKTVILIIELGHEKERHFLFLNKFADVVYTSFEDGVGYLKQLTLIGK